MPCPPFAFYVPLLRGRASAAQLALSVALVLGLSGCTNALQQLNPMGKAVAQLNAQAQEAINAGDYPTAVARLESAKALMPNSGEITFNLASAYAAAERWELAATTYASAASHFAELPMQDKARLEAVNSYLRWTLEHTHEDGHFTASPEKMEAVTFKSQALLKQIKDKTTPRYKELTLAWEEHGVVKDSGPQTT